MCDILSASMFSIATLFFILKTEDNKQELSEESVHFAKYLGLNLNVSSVHIILSITIIISLAWMMFSVLLIVGILRNNVNFVLSYFLFGIVINIISMLSALLVLLQGSWVLSICLFVWALFHIRFLIVIHTAYDLMNIGKDFRFRRQGNDVDLLVECFDDDLDE
ncbi:hypothetical protein HW555_003553 [Spodoptera exigua]|uniref:Uncharacterized protein n=1 Tax=Spodoptera exigua TaxID=7107 RepID=A0A835GP53_SPOEX|nr:hypothetical protein HW555_003553 [Spodoptera exigua]